VGTFLRHSVLPHIVWP